MPKIQISPEKLTQSVQRILKQKKLLQIAGGILVLLIVILGVQFASDYESADTQAIREELATARESLQQADQLLFQGDRASASEYIDSAEASAQRVLNTKSKDFRSDAQVILIDAQEKRLQAENAVEKTPDLRANLGIKAENFESVGIVELGDSLYAYDQKSTVKTVRNIVDVQTELTERAFIIGAAPRPGQNTIVFLSSGPYEIIELREGVVQPMGTEDETWKNAIDIENYGSRFSYFLDPTENQIWKYERRRSRYSGAAPYNESDTDLSQAVSFTIDGSIYVLNDDGSIIRFFRGSSVSGYEFTNLPSLPFSGPELKIYTSENLDYLYVLDPENERILMFDKNDDKAVYRKQILYGIPDASDFIVDESGQRASFIAGDKIYEVSL